MRRSRVSGWLGRCGAVRRRSLPSGCPLRVPVRENRWCGRGACAACCLRSGGGSFPPLKGKEMRERPPRVAVFPASGLPWSAPRAMRLVGARPPLSLLVRRRDGSRPERGLVWSVCAWFLVLVCCLCALVCG